ncbi:MAG: hypothetical protein AB7N65_18135 [Vicinamibacterales bacterium]
MDPTVFEEHHDSTLRELKFDLHELAYAAMGAYCGFVPTVRPYRLEDGQQMPWLDEYSTRPDAETGGRVFNLPVGKIENRVSEIRYLRARHKVSSVEIATTARLQECYGWSLEDRVQLLAVECLMALDDCLHALQLDLGARAIYFAGVALHRLMDLCQEAAAAFQKVA